MRRVRFVAGVLGIAGLIAAGTACNSVGAAKASAPSYTAVTRDVNLTAVPLLVHEQASTFDWLAKAFKPKGLLDGKEVWGFAPSAITVYQWDSVNVSVLNPGDDPHTFTISELGVNIPIAGASLAKGNFQATKVGTFKYFCSIPEHFPYMQGTITVLPDSAASPS